MSYGQIIGARVPSGFAGEIARGEFDYTSETRVNDASKPVKAFGIPVKLTSTGAVTPVTAAADAVHGFSIRIYGQADMAGAQAEKAISVLRRGYLFVKAAGTPAAGGQVYLATDGSLTAEKSTNTALAGAQFVNAADNGVVEIAYNI